MNHLLEKEINALLDLLDDPDNKVFESVRNRFLEIGIQANNALENAWSLSLDNDYQKKIEWILDEISQSHAKVLANIWLKNNPYDILEGYLALSKFQYPSLNSDAITKDIDNITKNIWLEINNQLTSLEKTRIINHILFQILKFKPITTTPDISKYFYLNQLLETKNYTICSISLLYLIIAQKLNIPIYGVIFKEIFLLCYVDNSPSNIEDIKESNILFYIDAFHNGNVISKDRLLEIGNKISIPASPKEYLPQKPIYLILYLIKQISLVEKEKNNFKKSEDLMNFYYELNKLIH